MFASTITGNPFWSIEYNRGELPFDFLAIDLVLQGSLFLAVHFSPRVLINCFHQYLVDFITHSKVYSQLLMKSEARYSILNTVGILDQL